MVNLLFNFFFRSLSHREIFQVYLHHLIANFDYPYSILLLMTIETLKLAVGHATSLEHFCVLDLSGFLLEYFPK